jgi:hypothetical protein
MSFFKKRKFETLGDENQNKLPETIKKNITTEDDDDDIWGLSLPKSSSPKKSPKKKAATQPRKTKTIKTSTPVKKSTGSRFSQAKAQAKPNLPTIFERKQANALLDSITDEEDVRYAISSMKPENIRPMIRYATDSKKFKTLTPIQETFLQKLNTKIKTENPRTRMIHEETKPIAELKINWTTRESPLPRGVIVIAHTHGGFVHSNDLIKYPGDVSHTLESVSTYYLSDIGATVCNIREDYKQFDEMFIRSLLLHGPDSLEEGFSIKDISEKTQEGFKRAKFKGISFDEKKNILENYFEAGVYNLAISTKTNNIPFLNKRYSCGKRGGEVGGYKLQSIQVFQEDRLKPLSEIIGRKPEFDCQNEHSSITTFELVKELCKVIDGLEHVLVIDTSCSPFTPSIVKEIFKEIPDDSTPHKHRETGLFKEMSPSPEKSRWDDVFGSEKKTKQELQKQERKQKLKTIKVNLKKYFDEGLKGGKKTKKRHHRYNKNKSIKNKNKRSRKYTKTYYMRGGATSEQIAAAVVMRPLILTLTGSKKSKQYKDLNRIIHHEGKHANFYSHEEPEYTFNYSQLAQEVIENAYDIINKNQRVSDRIKNEIEIVKNKAAASADPALALKSPGASALESPGASALELPGASALQSPGASALESPGASALESPGASALESPATQKKTTMFEVLSKPGRLSSLSSSSTISSNLAKVLSHGNGSL